MKNTLGNRIAEKRKALGMTQEELAEQVGVSAQAVSKWENDLSCPDIMTLPILGRILGCSVDALLTGEEDIPKTATVSTADQVDRDKLMLRIIVDSSDGDKVRINLPLPLVKVFIEAGLSMDSFGGSSMKGINVDWPSILAMIERGAMGRLVDIDSSDGDKVVIVVE